MKKYRRLGGQKRYNLNHRTDRRDEMKEETYYSECCHTTMPDYPDSDFCPKCGEHACGYTQEDIDREEGQDGRLLK